MRYLAMAAGAALVLAAPAQAEDWDFILINDSGKEIKGVELTPSGGTEWQKEVVDAERKKEALTHGKRTTVHFDKGASQCRYDVRATFADETTTVWTGINVCDNAFVTLRYRNGAPVFAAN